MIGKSRLPKDEGAIVQVAGVVVVVVVVVVEVVVVVVVVVMKHNFSFFGNNGFVNPND